MAAPHGDEHNANSEVMKWTFVLGGVLVALVLGWLLVMPGDQNTRSVATPPPGNSSSQNTGSSQGPGSDNTGSAIPRSPTAPDRIPEKMEGVPPGGANSDSTRGTPGPATGTERQR